jgi:hypothetical protein
LRWICTLLIWLGISSAAAGETPLGSRVEARSADILAVGVVSGARMVIHLSRLSDNSPVRDASVTVLLRGTVHPARAEPDGSYSVETPDLALPGTAHLAFQIVEGSVTESLTGDLTIGGPAAEDKNGARQLWWWVLNFAVCIGFLRLWSQRRKAAAEREASSGD